MLSLGYTEECAFFFYEGEEEKTRLSWREMSQQVQTYEVLLSGAAGFRRRYFAAFAVSDIPWNNRLALTAL